jgi:predicted membrane channel-forming protein YqfA (hemolysin III family)
MARRRSHRGLVLAGIVVILAGFAVALTEALHFPKGSIWVVVGVAVLIVGAIRYFTRPHS